MHLIRFLEGTRTQSDESERLMPNSILITCAIELRALNYASTVMYVRVSGCLELAPYLKACLIELVLRSEMHCCSFTAARGFRQICWQIVAHNMLLILCCTPLPATTRRRVRYHFITPHITHIILYTIVLVLLSCYGCVLLLCNVGSCASKLCVHTQRRNDDYT